MKSMRIYDGDNLQDVLSELESRGFDLDKCEFELEICYTDTPFSGDRQYTVVNIIEKDKYANSN